MRLGIEPTYEGFAGLADARSVVRLRDGCPRIADFSSVVATASGRQSPTRPPVRGQFGDSGAGLMSVAVVQVRDMRVLVRQRGVPVPVGVRLLDRPAVLVLMVLVVDVKVVVFHLLMGVDVAVSLAD
jgi:hypothetical protein